MTSNARVYGKGISFPPRLGPNGRVRMSEGPENIRESIRVILLTEFDERVMLAEFGGGLRSYLFKPNTVATRELIKERVKRALIRWEARIRVKAVTVEGVDGAPDRAVMTIEYKLVATGETDRTDLTLQFASI
jgi:phage baseplate assembly protein W